MTNGFRRPVHALCGAAAGACLLAATAVAQTLPMEVRTMDETAVPGGVLQLKLEVTEPRPIFTGGGGWSFDGYSDFLALAVGGSADSAAVGVMRGAGLKLRMVAPSHDLAVADYPILMTALRVPASRIPGQTSVATITIDSFTGPGGVPIPTVGQPGTITVNGGAWIGNVEPGSARVPAGGVITITGGGFIAGQTSVTLSETPLSSVTVLDPSTIEIVPSQAVTMHGEELRVEVGNGGNRQRLSYFSYQRTTPFVISGDPLFGAVEPAFQRLDWTAAMVAFPAPSAGRALGLSLQNTSGADATITLRLVNGAAPAAPLTFSLPDNQRVSVALAEIFGTSCTAACTVRVAASQPIQVLGLHGDRVADAVDPVLPVADTLVPTVLGVATAVNAASFRTGDPFVVTATFTPGDDPTEVDAYAVLQFPDGQFHSLTPQGLVPGILPLRRTTVAASSTVDLLRLPLPAGAAPGQYTWLSALAVPGTLSLLTPIHSTTFTVVP